LWSKIILKVIYYPTITTESVLMNRNFAIFVLVFINILWGSTYGITKVALEEIPPPLLGAMRWILATIVLWVIQLWLVYGKSDKSGAKAENVTSRDKVRLASLGALGIGIAYVIGYFGINLTTATDASLMIIGEVIFTSLLATWLTHDPLGRWKVVGMGLGAAGVTILVLGHITGASSSQGMARAIGDGLILVTLALQAIYTVLGTNLARKYRPMTVLTYVCTGSLLIWLPVLLWQVSSGAWPATLSLRAIGGVLYLALIASVFCNFVWFSIASRIGAGLSAISLFAQPLVGSFIGLVFLNEPATVSLLIGATLIFIALYLTTIADPATAPIATAQQAQADATTYS
jgi:drug/metabolite transporter (DMT)-like permease